MLLETPTFLLSLAGSPDPAPKSILKGFASNVHIFLQGRISEFQGFLGSIFNHNIKSVLIVENFFCLA